nr:MAG TPA: hypothetical protein [Bacteriophage sp.]
MAYFFIQRRLFPPYFQSPPSFSRGDENEQ